MSARGYTCVRAPVRDPWRGRVSRAHQAHTHTHARTMGIHGLIPRLRAQHGEVVHDNTRPAMECDLLLVDLMNALFMLTVRHGPGGGGADGAGPAPVPALLTGAQAFEIVSRRILAWLTTAALPCRAYVITDKGAWVPQAKQREQAKRRVAQEAQAEKARAAGTYMDFSPTIRAIRAAAAAATAAGADAGADSEYADACDDADGPAADMEDLASVLVFTDDGVIAPATTGSTCAVPFDGFSVIHQREVRLALVTYLAQRFANVPLPPGAELILDMDDEEETPLRVNARAHPPLDPSGRPCPCAAMCIGHALCSARAPLQRVSRGTGEAEVLAIQYALAYARTTPNLRICIMSADSDTVAVACRAFWDAPNGARLVWYQSGTTVVDLTGLYAAWHHWPVRARARPCSPERIMLALIALGTDYAEKRDLFNFINEDVLWDAICAWPLPGEPAGPAGGADARRRLCHAGRAPPPPVVPFRRPADAMDEEPEDTGLQRPPPRRANGALATPMPPSAPASAPAHGAAGARVDVHMDAEVAADEEEDDGPVNAFARAQRQSTQRVRRWTDVEALVMHVYATVAATVLKGAVTNRRAADEAHATIAQRCAAFAAGRGPPATRAEIEAVFACHKQRRISVPPPGRAFEAACANVVTNLSYWYAVPMNEQRIDMRHAA